MIASFAQVTFTLQLLRQETVWLLFAFLLPSASLGFRTVASAKVYNRLSLDRLTRLLRKSGVLNQAAVQSLVFSFNNSVNRCECLGDDTRFDIEAATT